MPALGSNVRSILEADDPLWRTGNRQVVEVVSRASNDLLTVGIGTGPSPGDLSQTGVPVPLIATRNPYSRYLIRLCGIAIPKESGLNILSIGQYATILAGVPSVIPGSGPPITGFKIFERPIVTPTWSFAGEGNISWHVQYQPNRFTVDTPAVVVASDPGRPLASDTGFEALSAAVLYNGTPFLPYIPPGGDASLLGVPGAGVPPGMGVEDLGEINEIRFPWFNTNWCLNYFLPGPGVVVFYASVYQPDPTQRTVPTTPLTSQQYAALVPEDQFVLSYPFSSSGTQGAMYGRVAGKMVLELIPQERCFEKGPGLSLVQQSKSSGLFIPRSAGGRPLVAASLSGRGKNLRSGK